MDVIHTTCFAGLHSTSPSARDSSYHRLVLLGVGASLVEELDDHVIHRHTVDKNVESVLGTRGYR